MNAIERWLDAAQADAERRELPELKALLRGMAASISVLRAAPWNERADAPAGAPADAGREARQS